MSIGSTPSLTTACGTSTSATNCSNHASRFSPLSRIRSAVAAFLMSPGVGSYPWISAPALVIDSTRRCSPATVPAMSASTVKVVSTVGRSSSPRAPPHAATTETIRQAASAAVTDRHGTENARDATSFIRPDCNFRTP
ncbi:Uncharacterised protein [Mycobacteroides abscessus subsp. abscessus]|nr:Uncharacterised protein [Mycobacteroides abscessus subsp. abscessus]